MQVQGVGAFVRVLLTLRLTDGYSATFGAWMGVHPDDLRRAYDVWWEPGYQDLQLSGVLANMIPPFEDRTYRRPIEARVEDPDRIPIVVGSPDDDMADLLTTAWPHALVLDALAPHFG